MRNDKIMGWLRFFIAGIALISCSIIVMSSQQCGENGITDPVFPPTADDAYERTNKDPNNYQNDPDKLREVLGDNFLRIQILLWEDRAVLISLPRLYNASGDVIQYDQSKVKCRLFNDVTGVTGLFSRAQDLISYTSDVISLFSLGTDAWKLADAHGLPIAGDLAGYGTAILQSAEIKGIAVKRLSDITMNYMDIESVESARLAADCVASAVLGLRDIQQFALQALGNEQTIMMGHYDVLTIDLEGVLFSGISPPDSVAFDYAYMDFDELSKQMVWMIGVGSPKELGVVAEQYAPWSVKNEWMGLHTLKTKMLFMIHTRFQDELWRSEGPKPTVDGSLHQASFQIDVSTNAIIRTRIPE